MTPRNVTPGIQVTVRVPIPASYSGYGGNPIQSLRPGMVATVASVRVPKVRIVPGAGKDKRDVFCNVTFTGDNGAEWRAGVHYCNLVRV